MYRESDPEPRPMSPAIPLPPARPEPGSMDHFWSLVDEVPADDVLRPISVKSRRDRGAGPAAR